MICDGSALIQLVVWCWTATTWANADQESDAFWYHRASVTWSQFLWYNVLEAIGGSKTMANIIVVVGSTTAVVCTVPVLEG